MTQTNVKQAGRPALSTLDITYIALFAVLMAVCSWISIPTMVPFTLQTFAVFVSCGVLGGKRGTLAVLVYILLGAVGLPVFAGFTGGIGILFGSTGGYIVGFLFSALLYWGIIHVLGEKMWVTVLAMVIGLIACYAFGTVWFMVVYGRANGAIGLMTALGWCVFPYIVPDGIKIALAVVLTRTLKPYVR